MKRRGITLVALLLAFCSLFCSCAGGGEAVSTTASAVETTTNTGGTPQVPTEPTTQDFIINSQDIVNLTAADVRAKETMSGKQAAVSIDIVCELYNTALTRAMIKNTITAIKNLGISRVYLIMCSPSYPLVGGGNLTALKTGVSASNHVEKTLKNVGEDPNKVYIDTCHALGLETVAIIKPYEGGGSKTIPHGKNVTDITSSYSSSVVLDAVGGGRIWFDSFISEHPEMLVQRKEGTGAGISTKVKKIEMLYYGDAATDLNALNTEAKDKPLVWISLDNASYTLHEGYTYSYDKVSNYTIYDSNGVEVMKRNCLRLTVTMADNFALPYVAVSFGDQSYIMTSGSYYTRPYDMCCLYAEDGTKIPSTLGYYVRQPSLGTDGQPLWGTNSPVKASTMIGVRLGADNKPMGVYATGTASTGAENFYQYGFEFEYVYTSEQMYGQLSPVYAFAVGKNQYLQGILCEGYEEVRAYWLAQVKSAMDYGADGIDIRYDGHSAMVSDFYYYGYNEPIAKRYLEKYGVALNSEPVNSQTAKRVMEIRGEYFMMFLEDASALVHSYGGIFVNHIFATSYQGYIGKSNYKPDIAGNCFAAWKMPKVIIADYEKLIDISDEIVYKDYFSAYFGSSDQAIGKTLTDYAHSKGKKVWIHCYVQQNPKNLNDKYMENFVQSYADGMTMYEIVPSFDYGTAQTYLEKYVLGDVPYKISIMGRISGVKTGTTAAELISMMNLLGENVVVDAEGNSVSLDTVLTADMRLRLNGDVFYTLQLS